LLALKEVAKDDDGPQYDASPEGKGNARDNLTAALAVFPIGAMKFVEGGRGRVFRGPNLRLL
jgi:hypothetical protein